MAERRVWEIVRKYARRWLDKVRRRLRAPKDLQHESVWIGKSKGVLDDMMKYLKEISGYGKIHYCMNIKIMCLITINSTTSGRKNG